MDGTQRQLRQEAIKREPGSARKFIFGMHLLRPECEDKVAHFVQVSVLGPDSTTLQQSIQRLQRRLVGGIRLQLPREADQRDCGNVEIATSGSPELRTVPMEMDVHFAQV